MTIARIENGGVAELREMALDSIPEHKRGAWRTVAGDKPSHNTRLETISGPEWVISDALATRAWSVTRKPVDTQRAAVKDEARRRILAVYPDWKQVNMLALGVQLQDTWRSAGQWTPTEEAQAAALQAAWAWISAVRSASDTIEAMDPIPFDYDDNTRWPA